MYSLESSINCLIYGFMHIWDQQMQGFSIYIFSITSAIGALISFLGIYIKSRINGIKFNIHKFILSVLWVAYICFMFQIAIYRRDVGAEHRVRTYIDFGSFHGDFVAAYQVGYCAMNMLFFVPFALLLAKLRLIDDHNENLAITFILVALCSFLGSFVIEITQLITGTGIFELTDIMINTIGGIFGAAIVVTAEFLRRKITR